MVSNDCLEWLEYARKDISVADHLYEKQQNPRHRPHEAILFHCQQGAEKALKAFIVQGRTFPPKTHDLQDLLSLCIKYNTQFGKVRIAKHCAFLTPFAVIVRYPKHSIVLDSVQSERGLNSAKRIYDFVCERLGLKTIYNPKDI